MSIIETETMVKRKIKFGDLLQIPKRLRPTGPGGRGRRPAQTVPNPELTSEISYGFIEDSAVRTGQAETKNEEKKVFIKTALAERTKAARRARGVAQRGGRGSRGGRGGRGRGR